MAALRYEYELTSGMFAAIRFMAIVSANVLSDVSMAYFGFDFMLTDNSLLPLNFRCTLRTIPRRCSMRPEMRPTGSPSGLDSR